MPNSIHPVNSEDFRQQAYKFCRLSQTRHSDHKTPAFRDQATENARPAEHGHV